MVAQARRILTSGSGWFKRGGLDGLDVDTDTRMMKMPCKVCGGVWPPPEYLISEGKISMVYLFEDQFFPGWTVAVLKRHATELGQLSVEERHRLIDEVTALAEALTAVFSPVKINYELLGNQLPHIHWHVIPRLENDPAPRDPVWTVAHAQRVLSQSERRERINLIRAQLQC